MHIIIKCKLKGVQGGICRRNLANDGRMHKAVNTKACVVSRQRSSSLGWLIMSFFYQKGPRGQGTAGKGGA
jgi:hypothetical protein